MTRTLSAVLITLGDPGQLTGGYLFHRRLAELAPAHGARLTFVSFPTRPCPLAVLDAPYVMHEIRGIAPDVVVVDSIATAFMAFTSPRVPMLGMLHQPPGGIDHGRVRTAVQAVLDRLAYRRLRRLLVASEALAEELRQLSNNVSVVPPGRDVASRVGRPARDVATGAGLASGDLRRGRDAAFLCVGN